jgi:hypothetical protein
VIGFEFETSTQIKWSDGDGLRDKQDALFGTLRGRFRPQPGQDPGPAWKVSCDTGHLEIVTEPFDNEAANADAEKERMAGVFADIRIFTDLLAAEGEVTLTADSLEGVATVSDPAKGGVTFSVTGSSMWAAPQATIGFTLDKIWSAASSLVNTNLRIFEAAERSVRQETPGGISLSGMNPIQGKCLVDAATQARAQIKSLHDRVLQNQPCPFTGVPGIGVS